MADSVSARLKRLAEQTRVKPATTVSLPKDFDPGFISDFRRDDDQKVDKVLSEGLEVLADYQDRLAAQQTYALLVVLQGIDAAGKDSTIKHVMSGVNPQWVEVHAFKEPSAEELNHDFLWRYAQKLPRRGKIGIFNRSHYEEVLVVRVHPHFLDAQHLPPEERRGSIWKRRFQQINDWERYLVANGIHVLKLFLNVSKEEQRKRFLERIDEPKKHWKFTINDVKERAHWDAYQKAYADVLSNTSTDWAPWHVIPADHKWFERIAAAAAIIDALVKIDPRYPTSTPAERKELGQARRLLLAESARKA